jgi:hypothetical protein
MVRIGATLFWGGLLAATVTGALAQSGGKIPIEQDLRRERADQRQQQFERRKDPPLEFYVPPTNRTGVVGFDGPPGIVGDSVNSYGPLPPGASGNEDQW